MQYKKIEEFFKPNISKIIIAIILGISYVFLLIYVDGPYLCDANCAPPSKLQKTLHHLLEIPSQLFNFTVYVYDLFENIGIYLFFDKVYISKNAHTLIPRFSFVSIIGSFAFNTIGFIFGLTIYLGIWYIISCLIYNTRFGQNFI